MAINTSRVFCEIFKLPILQRGHFFGHLGLSNYDVQVFLLFEVFGMQMSTSFIVSHSLMLCMNID